MSINIDLGNFWNMLSAIRTVGTGIFSFWLDKSAKRVEIASNYC